MTSRRLSTPVTTAEQYIVNTDILGSMFTNTGQCVRDLSMTHKIMLVFLRHTGCVFCEEAVKDVADIYPVLLQFNTLAVLVHMEEPSVFQEYLREYKNPIIYSFQSVHDKHNIFADAFGVVNELSLSPSVLKRSVALMLAKSSLRKDFLPKEGATMSRKPALFILENGQIAHEFRHPQWTTR
jgi:hypothetical protein